MLDVYVFLNKYCYSFIIMLYHVPTLKYTEILFRSRISTIFIITVVISY